MDIDTATIYEKVLYMEVEKGKGLLAILAGKYYYLVHCYEIYEEKRKGKPVGKAGTA